MKTRVAKFLQKNRYNYPAERKYLCEVYYEDTNYIDNYGNLHEELKIYIFKNYSPKPKIVTFEICADKTEYDHCFNIKIGFADSESAKKFIEKLPLETKSLFKPGGVLSYSDPALTYKISIPTKHPSLTKMLVHFVMKMHEFDALDKATLQTIFSVFNLPGLNPFDEEVSNKLISAYGKGAMMGLFAQSKLFPPELGPLVSQYLNVQDAVNVSMTAKPVLARALHEYEQEEEKISYNLKRS